MVRHRAEQGERLPVAPESPGLFELRGASVRWREQVALGPIDLAIERGKTTVILGPSGCGKTTLLRLLLGLVAPDAGEVLFEGRRVEAASVLEVRRRVGYVVQGGGLFPHLSARGNVTLLARWLGWDAARMAARVGELARLVQLPEEALARFPANLSGGQAQRVALMRALMLDPDVLLFDEPLGALDPITRFELQSELKALFARLGRTVVLVTHDLAEAVHFADRIVLMREGRVVQAGSYAALRDAPADPFVTRFIASHRALPEAP